ncbi:uncharacterized protein [Panulirus ornatus]|uniref:uncharacterized protein isoform X3 n=1 Tax=Panulirus ornatus TaxID=150431 RepID=UPI003A859649
MVSSTNCYIMEARKIIATVGNSGLCQAMQCQNEDLWGPVTTVSADAGTEPIGFEDSFSPQQALATEGGSQQYTTDCEYIPLEDSSQYLAGLERKLACVQGRTAASRQTESRRLIDALTSSRDNHTHQLMHTVNNVGTNNEVFASNSDHCAAHTTAAVDPQGALGAVLRRVAPDKIALTPEELCHLLEADILSKVHEVLQDEAEMPQVPTEYSENSVRDLNSVPQLPLEHSKCTVEEFTVEDSISVNAGIKTENSVDRYKINSSSQKKEKPQLDHKEQLFDEGEK